MTDTAQDEASRAAAEATRLALDEALEKANTLKRLKTALASNRLVIVTGVGVTLDATGYVRNGDLERLTWKGLLEHGFRYLERVCKSAISDQKKVQECSENIALGRLLLGQAAIDSHLLAAQILRKELEGAGHFATWLDNVFDGLEVKNEAVLRALKALHAKGATLLTTNYDHLLDRYCNLETIRRTATNDLLRFRRGRAFKDGIFHIHGSYQDPADVILDPIDYYKVTVSVEVQDFLRRCLVDDTVLFVGCGDGLGDANFSALLKWITQIHTNIAHTHCLLIKNDDHYNFSPLLRLKYGEKHSDLGPWLSTELLGNRTEVEHVGDSPSGDSNVQAKSRPQPNAFVLMKYLVQFRARQWRNLHSGSYRVIQEEFTGGALPHDNPFYLWTEGIYQLRYPAEAPVATVNLSVDWHAYEGDPRNPTLEWAINTPESLFYPGTHRGNIIFTKIQDLFADRSVKLHWTSPIFSPFVTARGILSSDGPLEELSSFSNDVTSLLQSLAHVLAFGPYYDTNSPPPPFKFHSEVGWEAGTSKFFWDVDRDRFTRASSFFARAYNVSVPDEDEFGGIGLSKECRHTSVTVIRELLQFYNESVLEEPIDVTWNFEEAFETVNSQREWALEERRWADKLIEACNLKFMIYSVTNRES